MYVCSYMEGGGLHVCGRGCRMNRMCVCVGDDAWWTQCLSRCDISVVGVCMVWMGSRKQVCVGCTHMYTYTRKHVCRSGYRICVCVHVYVCMYVYGGIFGRNVCLCGSGYCMYVCMYVFAHVCVDGCSTVRSTYSTDVQP